MNIYLDIETCPSQNAALKADFLANIKAPGQYKKPESIAEWMKENAEKEADEQWRKTSFDGAYGHICVIGHAVDNNPAEMTYAKNWHEDEALVLKNFYSLIDAICEEQPNERPTFIGHNLIEFDLRFMFQRSVVLGVKPSRFIPFSAKPWDDGVYDTMLRWGAQRGGSLDKITKACGLDGKGDIDGSMVWDYVQAGRIDEIALYCAADVDLTRELHKRMTFAV